MQFDYLQLLHAAAPETILVMTTFLVLTVDLLVLRDEELEQRFLVAGTFACFGCLAAIFWTANTAGQLNLLDGMLVSDGLIRLVKVAILALTILTILLAMAARFSEHVGEYLALVLLATIGMLFLVSSEELLILFVALELTSLCLYILTAFNKRSIQSSEAALKYFFFGGMSTAFTLFGMSLLYGLSGSTSLREISQALRGHPLSPLAIAAIVMTLVGFGFKVAAAPFHLWAPDAYQGAPTPSAALIASGSKVASFFILAKVLMLGLAGAEGRGIWRDFASGWIPALAMLAGLSMILGNLAAIVQTSVKRLLAYSAIAHAGYALLGIAADSQQGVASLVYYVITYGLTVLGAFGVVQIVEQSTGASAMTDFAGLSGRSPFLAGCMLVFMLSLAGIPPLAGFFGKFYLFTAAVGSGREFGLLWLVILAIGMSAVSLYYYLQVLKQVYVVEASPEAKPIRVPLTGRLALLILAGATVVLGCAPNLLLARLVEAVKVAGL
jgi:NADH-quinone oxidoreductase subunit N